MAFIVKGIARTESTPTNGLQCVAYAESRFSSAPVYGSPFPDMSAADAGPVTSGEAFGAPAAYQLTVPSAGNYYVGCYAIGDPNQIITWEGTKMATPHTSLQGWTAIGTRGTTVQTTTIAAGSNGVGLPTGTINIANTAIFGASGYVFITVGAGMQLVKYSGTSGGTQLTGCTGGTGTLVTGAGVTQAFVNGSNRRLVMISFIAQTTAATDSAAVIAYSTLSGTLTQVGSAGSITPPAGGRDWQFQLTFPVDPLGSYGVQASLVGSGTILSNSFLWVEADF